METKPPRFLVKGKDVIDCKTKKVVGSHSSEQEAKDFAKSLNFYNEED
jgi:hypothetical protein